MKDFPPMNAIVAMSLNRVIGKNNTIPWHIPEDLKWFKKSTLNQTVVMGRKTFESLGERPLKNRLNVVLTKKAKKWDNVITINSLSELKNLQAQGKIWICGGANLYKQLFPHCQELYLSVIQKKIDGDTILPAFENLFSFKEIILENKDFIVQKWTRSKAGD